MRVLITGGSGLVGTKLTAMLLEQGHQVSHLSRNPRKKEGVEVYKWDVGKQEIAKKAIETADAIVHLAGAGVADKRWTAARKKEIMDSRVDSGKLLVRSLKQTEHSVKTFVSASGMAYYGDSTEKVFSEKDPLGEGFLAKVSERWEAASEPIEWLGIRRVVLRISIVLDKDGGALPKMAQPIKLGAGNYLGDGKQIYSWIHMNDMCRMIVYTLENDSVKGTFNAAAPEHLSNKEFTKELAKALNRPFIPVPVPKMALKILLGQMAETVLGSTAISPNRIIEEGFTFDFPKLRGALEEIY